MVQTDEALVSLSQKQDRRAFEELVRRTARLVFSRVYLEVGDRTAGDEGSYPDDDLQALLVDGKWKFVHKDGTPY